MSSIITISRPPANNTPESILENSNEAEFQRVENDSNDVNPDTDAEKSDAGNSSGVSESDNDTGSFKKEHARVGSLQKLQGSGTPSGSEHRGSDVSRLLSRQSRRVSKLRAKRSKSVDAVIVLKEEKAPVFHDFLKHAYPKCALCFMPMARLLTRNQPNLHYYLAERRGSHEYLKKACRALTPRTLFFVPPHSRGWEAHHGYAFSGALRRGDRLS
jgi:hypothetical protein